MNQYLTAFVCCIIFPSLAYSDELGDAVSSIKRLGRTVRKMGADWEVDFHLRGRKLTDNDLENVAKLKNVVALNLSNTKITGGGLAHLTGLKQLRRLHIEKTAIGDEGIEHLAKLPNLEYLNLYATKITDESLEQLENLKNLTRLYVWQTNVTDTGVAKLKKTLPDLKVVRGVDLSKLASTFLIEVENTKPKLVLKWFAVASRAEAPPRSENGVNCQILFENKSKQPVKLYWIAYGNGALKLYGTLAPGATRQQTSYFRNAWLITDENDQPLGYFVVEDDDSRAVIPGGN
jgi:hypothetical protein